MKYPKQSYLSILSYCNLIILGNKDFKKEGLKKK